MVSRWDCSRWIRVSDWKSDEKYSMVLFFNSSYGTLEFGISQLVVYSPEGVILVQSSIVDKRALFNKSVTN